MPVREWEGSSFWLFVCALAASCSVDLDDLTGGRKDAGARDVETHADTGPSTTTTGASGGAGSSGGAGGATNGGAAGSAGSAGSDRDASGTGGDGGEAGAGGLSGASGAAGIGGAGGASGASAPDATGGAGASGGGGMSGGNGSGGFAGTGAAGGQSGAAGTSGAGGADAGIDVNTADIGSHDAPRDQPTSGDGGLCTSGACKRVFVSSQSTASAGNFGGLAAGDAFCQSAASAQQLGGTWKAWLSDSASSASTRLAHAAVPYVLLDGTTVAANWSALTSGAIMHAIDVSEDGAVQATSLEVWTGTTSGGAYGGHTCNGWSTASSSNTADVGLSNETDYDWTNAFQQYCDRFNVHLYCFEQ